jgi:hypothetical protein
MTSWTDQFSPKNRTTSSMGRLRPSWNRYDPILRFLQVPNPLRRSRGFTSHHSRRGWIITLYPDLDLASCNAIERDGGRYECLAIDKSPRREYRYVTLIILLVSKCLIGRFGGIHCHLEFGYANSIRADSGIRNRVSSTNISSWV